MKGVPPSANPTVTCLFEPLLFLLQSEWDTWAIKRPTERIRVLTETQLTIQRLQVFIWQDDWKGAYLNTYNESVVVSLKKCFRGDKEKQKQALELYRDIMKAVVEWIKTKKE